MIWLDIEVVTFQYLCWNVHILSSAISVFNLKEMDMNYTNAIYADINLATQIVYFNQCHLVICPHLSAWLFFTCFNPTPATSWLHPCSFPPVYTLISTILFPGLGTCSICHTGSRMKNNWCYNGSAILIQSVTNECDMQDWQQFYSPATVTQGLQKLKYDSGLTHEHNVCYYGHFGKSLLRERCLLIA